MFIEWLALSEHEYAEEQQPRRDRRWDEEYNKSHLLRYYCYLPVPWSSSSSTSSSSTRLNCCRSTTTGAIDDGQGEHQQQPHHLMGDTDCETGSFAFFTCVFCPSLCPSLTCAEYIAFVQISSGVQHAGGPADQNRAALIVELPFICCHEINFFHHNLSSLVVINIHSSKRRKVIYSYESASSFGVSLHLLLPLHDVGQFSLMHSIRCELYCIGCIEISIRALRDSLFHCGRAIDHSGINSMLM